MTEAEWMSATDPKPMLEALGSAAVHRRLRLYCCACCRRVWSQLSRARQRAVELAEKYADGKAGWWGTLVGEFLAFPQEGWQSDPRQAVRMAAFVTVRPWKMKPAIDGVTAACLVARMTGGDFAQAGGQTDLVREIFGNPFRPVVFAPGWRTDTAVLLARQMYESRDFGAMPILADALQDAGCDSEDILGHCRDTKATHVRGCWVVDLILGKS